VDKLDAVVEILKTIATIAIPYIALLRTRTDIDRLAAMQRAKENGRPVETQLRRKWYHGLKKLRKK